MWPSQNKKHKTYIPVIKITPRNGGGDSEASVTGSHSQTSQSESHQSRTNQPQLQLQLQPSSLHAKSKTVKKNQCPETWADEVIQSQSQKMRNSSLSESRRRREDMEKHLKEAESQLVTMSNLLEQREKVMKEAAEEAEKKTEELENKLLNQECHLIKYGIDPVTGEQIILDEEGEKKVESRKKFTKKRVQEMREKLKQMNSDAESYLSDIENTLQYLNSLEVASERAGQTSEETLGSFGETDFEEYLKMYDQSQYKLTGSGGTSSTRLTQIGNENLAENLNIKLDDNEGNNTELLYEDSYKRLDVDKDNVDDENTSQDEVL